MKVGLSVSRCVKDIVEARVLMEDILVIVSGTKFDPYNDDDWENIWVGYVVEGVWEDKDENYYRHVCKTLYSNGKLHQPRIFGAPPPRVRWHWLDCVPDKDEMGMKPAVQKAWDNFNVIAGLTNGR